MAAEEAITSPPDQGNNMANVTGVSILLAIGEPFYDEQKELILERVKNSLLSCSSKESADGVDLGQELSNLVNQAPPSEEGPGGEQVIEYSSDNFRVTILANPQCQTFYSHLRQFVTSPAQKRHLVSSGPVVKGPGSWIFQDDLVSFSAFNAIFKEADVLNALKQQEGTAFDIYVTEEGDWSPANVSKQGFSNIVNVRVNPTEGIQSDDGVAPFMAYLSQYIRVRTCKELLQSSDVVGNIRFTRPTLYVFPGAQGDSALFGISGFNLLMNAGYGRKACFWDFTRHLDRIDAMLLTHLGTDNLFGVSSVFERKACENVHPEIGYVYFNAGDKTKHSPNGDIHPENGGVHKPASLVVSLAEQGKQLIENIKMTGQSPQSCIGHIQNGVLQPLNLYHKVGHGTLDMYILNPIQDSKDLKEFLSQWNKNVANFSSTKNHIPLPSQVSICALLVWKPASPNEDITRILFPGNAPQEKVFEGLDKLKTLDIFKHATCSETSLHAPKKKPAAGGVKSTKAPSNARSSPIPRGSPVPPTAKAEPKKTATSPDKKPTTTRSAAPSKPAKDAKNKKATGAAQKDKAKSPTSSSTPSKGTSPSTTSPVGTATPSNTPIEADVPVEPIKEVAAEISASLETQKSPETASPQSPEKSLSEAETSSLVSPVDEVKSPEQESPVEPPVVTPEDVQPVVDAKSAPETATGDLLGDFSAPMAQEPEPEPQVPDAKPDEIASVGGLNGTDDLTPVEPEPTPLIEPVLQAPAYAEQPQAVPDPVQMEPMEQPADLISQDFAAFQQKEVDPEKDEDTSLVKQAPGPNMDEPEANGFSSTDPDSEVTSPAADPLMDSPKALPDPQELAPTACLETMQASFSEDRGENLFAPPPQKDHGHEDLPEAEQSERTSDVAAVDQTFDDILNEHDTQKTEAERQRFSISSEEDQVLPTPEEARAEIDFEYTRQETRELERPPAPEEVFDPVQQEQVSPVEQAPAQPESEAERKQSLADFGIMDDDTALVEGIANADPATLQELGIYDEPEADQQQQQKEVTEIDGEVPVDAPPVVDSQPDQVEADQGIPQSDDFAPPPMDLQVPAVSSLEQDDVDKDSLVDTAAEVEGHDFLECQSNIFQDIPSQSSVEPPADVQSSNPFDLVDAAREECTEPFNNPFVGVGLNSSAQHNDFNIPDASATNGSVPMFCQQQEQQHFHAQQEDADRDSLEREETKSFDPLADWGQPMGLPAPDGPEPRQDPKKSDGARKAPASKTSKPMSGTAAAKKPTATTRKPAADTKKAPERATSPRKAASASTAKSADATARKTMTREAPEKKSAPAKKPAPAKSAPAKSEAKPSSARSAPATKRPAASAAKAPAPVKLAPVTPFYVDLTYVPGHGDSHYSDFDFFRRVRARYYVLSSLNPSASLLTALVDAKQTWDDPSLEVTVIPTYDTDTLRHWMALNRDQINQHKIDFAPSASRCTIQLQDLEASCAAYRLEF